MRAKGRSNILAETDIQGIIRMINKVVPLTCSHGSVSFGQNGLNVSLLK